MSSPLSCTSSRCPDSSTLMSQRAPRSIQGSAGHTSSFTQPWAFAVLLGLANTAGGRLMAAAVQWKIQVPPHSFYLELKHGDFSPEKGFPNCSGQTVRRHFANVERCSSMLLNVTIQ